MHGTREPFPEDMISYAKTLNNQGALYKEMGDYGMAGLYFLRLKKLSRNSMSQKARILQEC